MKQAYERVKEKIEKIKNWIPLTVEEVLNMKLPKSLFLIEDLVPEQGITVISGHPGSCKSWILMHMAYCVSKGKPLFDNFETKIGDVLMIDEESGINEIHRRMESMKIEANTQIYFFSDKGVKVDNPEILEKIIAVVKAKNIKLVIFDPFISIHNKLENSSEEIQRVIEALRKITIEGAAVVFAHHNRKDQDSNVRRSSSQNMRGSSAIWAGVNSHLDIANKSESKDETILTLSHNKLKNGKSIKPFKIKMAESSGVIYFDYIGESFDNLSKRQKIEAYILEKLITQEELDLTSLYKNDLGGDATFREVLKKMEKDNTIKSRKADHGKVFYSIVKIANPDS